MVSVKRKDVEVEGKLVDLKLVNEGRETVTVCLVVEGKLYNLSSPSQWAVKDLEYYLTSVTERKRPFTLNTVEFNNGRPSYPLIKESTSGRVVLFTRSGCGVALINPHADVPQYTTSWGGCFTKSTCVLEISND